MLGGDGEGLGGGELKPVLLVRNLTLNYDAAPNYKYTVDSRYLEFQVTL